MDGASKPAKKRRVSANASMNQTCCGIVEEKASTSAKSSEQELRLRESHRSQVDAVGLK